MKYELGSIGLRTVGALVAVCLASTLGAGTVWAQPDFQFSKNGDTVVVRYSRTPGELEAPDRSTTVTVYGDGRAVVHYPPYGVRRGDYEMRLSKAQLNELVAGVTQSGVLEFDRQALTAEKQATLSGQNVGFYVGDADVTTLELTLDRYRPDGAAAKVNVQREITLSGLQQQALQFPSIPSLVNLAAAERQLLELIESEDLSPVR